MPAAGVPRETSESIESTAVSLGAAGEPSVACRNSTKSHRMETRPSILWEHSLRANAPKVYMRIGKNKNIDISEI